MVDITPKKIPDELKKRNQWVFWKKVKRENEMTKRPYNPKNGELASTTDNMTWSSFGDALRAFRNKDGDGIGFVFSSTDPFCGVDLDDVIKEGELSSDAKTIIENLQSYTEVSPSGNGFHIIVKGAKKGDKARKGFVEMYDKGRYFTFTGEVFKGYETIKDRQKELDKVYRKYLEEDTERNNQHDVDSVYSPIDESIKDLHQKAINADNGEKFRRLYNGSTGGYPSQSEADLALLGLMAFWSQGDANKMERWFSKSALGGREKWRNREDYRKRTIKKALQGKSDFYEGENDRERVNHNKEKDRTRKNVKSAGQSVKEKTGLDWDWEHIKSLYDREEKGSTGEANQRAVELLESNHTIVAIRDSGIVYFYDEERGYYRRNAESKIDNWIEKYLGEYSNKNRKREIREKLIHRNYIEVGEFKPPEKKLNVKNGILDLEDRELEPHNPEYYFTSQLNVEYNPDASGGLWVEQIERAISDKDEIQKLEEWLGYCLETWHHNREKNMFFVGRSRTGKSTIQEGIQALFDTEGGVASLTPQQIADTNFDAVMLFDAALNTVNDINASKIEDSGALKRVFSGERTKMEQKYKDPFFAEPYTKHLFTCNWTPKIVGNDEAIWRRILIIEFTNQVNEDEKDPSIKRAFKEDEEIRQVILNRALDAREKLKEKGEFTNDRSPDETSKLWEKWRNSNLLFLHTDFEITGREDDTIPKKEYMKKYKKFCRKNNFSPKSQRSVTSEFSYHSWIHTKGGENNNCYGGLRLLSKDGDRTKDEEQGTLI